MALTDEQVKAQLLEILDSGRTSAEIGRIAAEAGRQVQLQQQAAKRPALPGKEFVTAAQAEVLREWIRDGSGPGSVADALQLAEAAIGRHDVDWIWLVLDAYKSLRQAHGADLRPGALPLPG